MTSSPDARVHDSLPLHPLEFQILLSLMGGVRHAYDIVRDIEARQPEWSRILPTNLYRRIWRLVGNGLLEEVEVDTPAGERRRRYFGVTPLGRASARVEANRLRLLLREAERAGIHPEPDAPA